VAAYAQGVLEGRLLSSSLRDYLSGEHARAALPGLERRGFGWVLMHPGWSGGDASGAMTQVDIDMGAYAGFDVRVTASGAREVLGEALPALRGSLEAGRPLETAIVATHLNTLAGHPDSLIVRRVGLERALEVSRRAAEVLDAGWPDREVAVQRCEAFDAWRTGEGTMPRGRLTALAAGIGAGCILALINPFGIQTILFSLGTLTSPLIQNNIQECASPDFHSLPGLLVEGLIFLLLAGLATGRVRARSSEWLLAFALLYLALSSQRHVPLFVVAAAPLMGRCAQALLSLALSLLPPADRRPAAQAALRWTPARPMGHTATLGAINLVLLIVVAIGMIGYRAVPNLRPAAEAASIKASLPVQAADALARTGRPLRVFNYYDYGGYLVWRLQPDGGRVFIDGRVEVYGPEVFSRYLRVSYLAGGWQDVLAEAHPDAVVLPSAHPLSGILGQDSSWRLLGRDEVATVFIRVGFAP